MQKKTHKKTQRALQEECCYHFMATIKLDEMKNLMWLEK